MEPYDKEALVLKQKAKDNELICVVFIEEVDILVNMLTVARLEDGDKEGYQRLIKCTKIKSIANFLKKNPKNIIPNSITIAIGEELECDLNELENNSRLKFKYNNEEPPFINELIKCNDKHVDTKGSSIEYKPLIIDGQHRLYGLYKENPKNKIIVSAIINPKLVDQAFQFIVINQKSQKATTVDVKSVISSGGYDQELKDRLVEVAITYGDSASILDYFNSSSDSPFKGILEWSNNPNPKLKIIPITTIEQIYKIFHVETKRNVDEAELFICISTLWNKIKELFSTVWEETIKNPKHSNILRKTTLIAITEYLLSESKSKIREYRKPLIEFDKKQIEDLVINNLGLLNPDFFTSVWRSGLDTANGRETIKSSISIAIDNVISGEEWNTKIPVIDNSK